MLFFFFSQLDFVKLDEFVGFFKKGQVESTRRDIPLSQTVGMVLTESKIVLD